MNTTCPHTRVVSDHRPGSAGRAALPALLLLALATAPCRAADYTVHVLDPPITNHVVLPDGPLPPGCRADRRLVLRACAGEYESCSFVITARRPLEAVRVDVDPVTGPGGAWPPAAVDVRVVRTYPCSIAGAGPAPVPALLVHDPGFLAIEPAPTDDNPAAMAPVAVGPLRDAERLVPVPVERRRQFWVTVHVPDAAAPGTWHTTVRVASGAGEPTELALEIAVYPFDLLPPMLGYSIYYPTYLSDEPERFGQVTAEQMRLELANMLAHGLSNPNIYQGPRATPDGALDCEVFARILDIRESVGMRPRALYLVSHPILYTDRPLTADERRRNHDLIRQIDAWAGRRGYDEVFYMGPDEWWGEKLSRERDSMLSVGEAGGKVFVAVMHAGFFERVGDLLHLPVMGAKINAHLEHAGSKYAPQEALRHMAEIAQAGTFERKRHDPAFRKAIDGVHRHGHKVFTYMNPVAGAPFPQLQRRNEGLGLWRIGFDGTMTWAYTHIAGDPVDQPLHFAKVYRTRNGVVDTLWWEGFREGVDDVRYLTTLLDALNGARGRFPAEPLIGETEAWLAAMDVAGGDLDAIRREMARRTVALMDLGHRQLTSRELLAGVDVEAVAIAAFAEPWRFRMAPEGADMTAAWSDPATDDGDWGTMRTDTPDKGWGSDAGFGWYRARLPLTAAQAAMKHRYVYFGACDEDAWVYVNGKEVFAHTYETSGLLPSEIWMTPFLVDLAGPALRGQELVAVRVHNRGGMGGIWRPVRVIASDQPLTLPQVEALLEVGGGQ